MIRREYALPFIVLLPQWFRQADAFYPFHHLFLKVITSSQEKYLDRLARPYFWIGSHKIWTNSFVYVYNLRRIVTLFNVEQTLRF